MSAERVIAARGIIYKDGKIFAQKLHGNNFWSTPGGKLDPAEPLEDGVKRELFEETGVDAEVGRLLFVQQFTDGTYDYLEFFFNIENPDDFASIDLAATSHGEAEVAEFGFVDPKTETVLPAFLGEIALSEYVSSIRPVYFYHEYDQEEV